MKIRSGFISNSSSSSFVIEPENIPKVVDIISDTSYDYYLLADGRLITSDISDSDEKVYNSLYNLGSKYEYGHIDIHGDRGFEDVSLIYSDWMNERKHIAKIFDELSSIDNDEVKSIMEKYSYTWKREVNYL